MLVSTPPHLSFNASTVARAQVIRPNPLRERVSNALRLKLKLDFVDVSIAPKGNLEPRAGNLPRRRKPGFTGHLITRYLYAHPDRGQKFTFAVGARSKSKLNDLVSELSLDSTVETIVVDVTKPEQIESAVKKVKVVINTVGPYHRWGTPVVGACVRNGIHYVDLTGEAFWIRDIIDKFDYVASRTGSIVVPSSGFDSVPSDAVVFLANKTFKETMGLDTAIENSTTAVKIKGGISGGTLSTIISSMEEVPKDKLRRAARGYALSPVKGLSYPPIKLLYSLPIKNIVGSFFGMAPGNKQIVQRSWGLQELEARTLALGSGQGIAEQKKLTYGRQLKYDEFLAMPNRFIAAAFSFVFAVSMATLAFVKPWRWLVKKLVTQPGSGPSDESMKKGWFSYTNISSSVPTASSPRRYVETTIHAKGDPGYLATAVMISESALAILLEHDKLPALGRRGGILTPMTALGDVLIKRLTDTGRFTFNSELLSVDTEAKKTR
ncbi:hypothetical protein HWV62_24676 [Athelia sp. TMB]|nr:hypothetical protein HWV62_24676 [Athelia sp. TMB]